MEHDIIILIILPITLTPLDNISIKKIEITEKEIESLKFKYGPYSFYINLGTYIVYGIKSGEIKEMGKLIVSEDGNLEIEE
ncbi:hypothetical protein KAT63_00450 [Candidatus Parcubacteria bacterium]|nr:hypothetical protein [Candidatus Parcubacteria bacterium]